jgi:hypothetical protein
LIREAIMALEFIGKDPGSNQGESPTVWIESDTLELAILGWTADAATVQECLKSGGIRDDETVVRIPLRMAPFLREALERLEERDAGDGEPSGDAGA